MRKFTWLFALAIPVTIISCQKDAAREQVSNENPALESVTTGNGSESGSHFTLNILGTKDEKNVDMTNNNGHRIFVALGSKGNTPTRTDILLYPAPEGESFKVLDASGFGEDNDAAFQMPRDVATTYKVYARALGGPGGKAIMTTCADADLDPEGYLEVCSTVSTPALTSGPKPKFVDVTRELLTITVDDIWLDGQIVVPAGTYNVFDPIMEGYFWKYDNYGLKLLQLRFYPATATN